MSFEPIRNIITQAKWQQSPAKMALTNWSIERALTEVLQITLPRLVDKVKLINYKEGRLILKTSSPSISQEVYLNSNQIAGKLNEFFERKVVEKIRFKLT